MVVAGGILSSALNGCKVGPDYRSPDMKVPEAFGAAPAAAVPKDNDIKKDADQNKPPVDKSRWWKSMGDATLDGLVARAINANPQLEIALANVQQAREQEAVLMGQALPALEASGGAGARYRYRPGTRQGGSNPHFRRQCGRL